MSEKTMISAVLWGDKKWLQMLQPDHFYEKVYQKLWGGMQKLSRDGKDPNALEVSNYFAEDPDILALGGMEYVFQLSEITTGALAYSAVDIVKEKYAKRLTLELGAKIMAHADDDKFNVKQLPQLVSDANRRIADAIPRPLEMDLAEIVKELQTVDDKIPTGFPQMDAMLEGGLEAGWLYLIAARPSVGKSAMATTLVGNFLKNRIPVSLVSLEMNRKQVMKRILCGYFDVLRDEAVSKAHEYIPRIDTPYYVNTGSSDLSAILQEIYTSPAPVIIIDYFGLITMNSKENRFQQLDAISRAIKSAALESGKSVIMLAQLNRAVETDKGNRRPRLSDLRGSGEADADQITFLHDPNAKSEDEEDAGAVADALGGDATAELEWIIKKNRHGPTGRVKLAFDKPKFLMREIDSFSIRPQPTNDKPKPKATKNF